MVRKVIERSRSGERKFSLSTIAPSITWHGMLALFAEGSICQSTTTLWLAKYSIIPKRTHVTPDYLEGTNLPLLSVLFSLMSGYIETGTPNESLSS